MTGLQPVGSSDPEADGVGEGAHRDDAGGPESDEPQEPLPERAGRVAGQW